MRHHAFALTALLVAGAEIVAASCNPDNCLRALRATQTPGRLQSAQAFCATFTAAPVAPTNIPEYAASGCKANQNGDTNARLSSACACIAPTATAPAGEPCAQVSSLWASQVKATSKCRQPIECVSKFANQRKVCRWWMLKWLISA